MVFFSGRKGQVGFYFAFMVVALTIILVTAIFASMGARFSSEAYVAGENILRINNDTLARIQDSSVRNSLQTNNAEALSAAEQNIEMTTDLFKYSWVLVLVGSAVVYFLLTRRLTEFNSGLV
jgi:hypothetical protein